MPPHSRPHAPQSIEELIAAAEQKHLPDTSSAIVMLIKSITAQIHAPKYVMEFIEPLIQVACEEMVNKRKRQRNFGIRNRKSPIKTAGGGRRGGRRSAAGAASVRDQWKEWVFVPNKRYGDCNRGEIAKEVARRDASIVTQTIDQVFARETIKGMSNDNVTVDLAYPGLTLSRLHEKVAASVTPKIQQVLGV